MKKHNLIFLVSFILFLMLGKLNAQTVYITESGKKYHAKNCSLAKTGKKGVELADAIKQGYEACKSCKAPTVADKPKKKQEVKK
jgi:hypothetical protein